MGNWYNCIPLCIQLNFVYLCVYNFSIIEFLWGLVSFIAWFMGIFVKLPKGSMHKKGRNQQADLWFLFSLTLSFIGIPSGN